MPVANLITIIRYPLLLVFLLMIYFGNPEVQLLAVPFLFFALFLDTLDGVIARRTGTTSLMGSVLDIATDRTYELVLWVVLADSGNHLRGDPADHHRTYGADRRYSEHRRQPGPRLPSNSKAPGLDISW